MHAKIQPVQAFLGTATVLVIDPVTVQPGASATYGWHLQSDARVDLVTGSIYLTGEAYTAWGSDDDYLYTYTANFLGLTIVEIVPDAPPAPEPTPEPAPTEEPV